MLTYLLIIITMLILSAFFSGMEIAYISSNKIHIELEKRQDDFISAILRKLTAYPSKFIISMLIGNSIALVIYGIYMGELITTQIINPYLDITEGPQLVIQTIVSTLVILLTAEFLPKVFFQIYANELVKFFALPAYIFYIIFTPVSWICIVISDFFLRRIFKSNGDQIQLSFSKIEIGNYITEQMESAQPQDEIDSEIQIFQNALDFSNLKAREVMVPRTEIISVQDNIEIKELSKKFVNTGLSKILVHKETIDDITGYVHSFDLFKSPSTIQQVVRNVVNVPETMLAKDVLKLLLKRHKSIAIVLDEYGGTSGLITVEDIVEELLGEIQDEHDSDTLIDSQINENLFKFSARIEVDTINENHNLNLPESDQYETLGGLIVNTTQDLPQEGEIVTIDQFKFTILETSNNKIDLVQLEIIDTEY